LSRHVDATPEQVYDAVSDLRRMASWSQEYFGSWRFYRGQPSVGARFVGWNRNRWHVWFTFCTVVQASRPSSFVFESGLLGLPIARWGYQIAADPAGGCAVEESWQDLRGDNRAGAIARWLGAVFAGTATEARVRRNEAGIRQTLGRLAAELAAPVS
jgi:hypothetical protein